MKKVKASTILEFVIALTIIGICLSVATMIFSRSLKNTSHFQKVKEETVFQSIIMNALIKDSLPNFKNWNNQLTEMKVSKIKLKNSFKHLYQLEYAGKNGWNQDVYVQK